MKFRQGFLTIAGVVACALSIVFATACFLVISKLNIYRAALLSPPFCASLPPESPLMGRMICWCNAKRWEREHQKKGGTGER